MTSEGLRISIDDVPPQLRGVELMSLDLGLLQAGASVKGEFENRLKGVSGAMTAHYDTLGRLAE